jgi:diacylglycerol kinase (ATP)
VNRNKNEVFSRRVIFALDGIRFALKSEKSFKTHLLITSGLVALILFLKPPLLWVGLFAICVSQVLALELINAALESLCDHVTSDIHPKIKIAKDCAAGAVLICSGFSLFIFFLFILTKL